MTRYDLDQDLTQRDLARAVQSMRWAERWNKYGAGLICFNDVLLKRSLGTAFGAATGAILGHAFCFAQLGAAVYSGFSVTNPLYYILPPGLALAAKLGVDHIKPANGEGEKQQRRNFLKYSVGSSVLAMAWGMRGHMGFQPGGSYGQKFSKLNSSQQSYLEGEIGLYYFPQLDDRVRQKILEEAKVANKTPVAYVFDREGLAIMEICKTNRERAGTNISPIFQSSL